MKTFLNNFIFINTFSILFVGLIQATEFTAAELSKDESHWFGYDGEKFKLCRITSNGAKKNYKTNSIKVNFDEDSDQVSEDDHKKLVDFLGRLPTDAYELSLTAHADICGSKEHNDELSLRRGKNVWDVIKDHVPKKLKTDGKALGEETSTTHDRHDRYVEIIVKSPVDKEVFENIVIVDASGSLSEAARGRTKSRLSFERLKKYKFEPNTVVFVSRDYRFNCQGTNLSDYDAVGEDFYNEGMIAISSHTKGKVQGKIFTDYQDPNNRRSVLMLKHIDKDKRVRWVIK